MGAFAETGAKGMPVLSVAAPKETTRGAFLSRYRDDGAVTFLFLLGGRQALLAYRVRQQISSRAVSFLCGRVCEFCVFGEEIYL